MGRPALVDTNILIGLYSRKKYFSSYLNLVEKSEVLFSSVSLNEFIRGAHDKNSKDLVESFLTLVKDRLLTPTLAHWLECGRVSETLLRGKKIGKPQVVLLQNYILMALLARDAKARLITADHKDFDLIAPYVEFNLEYWDS